MDVTLLALETSCDETAAAVLQHSGSGSIRVLAAEIASQTDIHTVTGGVIPEVAAREHAAIVAPLVKRVLQQASVSGGDLDAIAVTVGPGLIPALVVGVQAARSLALTWGTPLVPVHHMEGHLYSALCAESIPNSEFLIPKSADAFPALALLVSGGHTMLVVMEDHLQYEVIGSTRDDAVGEAFDKVARMLDLPYPGGPEVSRLAATGDDTAFSFTPPMMQSRDLDFSFSGLKTEVRYAVRNQANPLSDQTKADTAASFERAAVTALYEKTRQALEMHTPKTLLLAGGVAANQRLRTALEELVQGSGVSLQVAPLPLCGDNAVMIGLAGVLAFEHGRTAHWRDVDAHARLSLGSL